MSTNINKEYHGRDWKPVAGRIGPILTLIMGVLFFIEGIIRIILFFLTSMLYPNTLFILMCGILAILGVLIGLKGYNNARFLCLIAGILAIVGILIFNFILRFILTIFAIILPVGFILYIINYIFPFILLIGGTLSVISGERFLSYYRKRRDTNPIQESKINILFCSNCGKKVQPVSKFCIYCGKQFNRLIKN